MYICKSHVYNFGNHCTPPENCPTVDFQFRVCLQTCQVVIRNCRVPPSSNSLRWLLNKVRLHN